MTDKQLVPTPSVLLKAGRKPDLVDVPERAVLSLDGRGAPSDPAFAACVGALYGIGYTLRFARKDAGRPVFKVGPLEGEWRVDGAGPGAAELPPPSQWRWVLRIGVPSDVSREDVLAAVGAATTKHNGRLEGSTEARRIELTRVGAARCARILHVGPYATEPKSFDEIGALLATEGLAREPWHIEVYLSDPGRTPPEKLKTVLLVKVG
jgi:hypothetical protein